VRRAYPGTCDESRDVNAPSTSMGHVHVNG
jgi:hypothetical protein